MKKIGEIKSSAPKPKPKSVAKPMASAKPKTATKPISAVKPLSAAKPKSVAKPRSKEKSVPAAKPKSAAKPATTTKSKPLARPAAKPIAKSAAKPKGSAEPSFELVPASVAQKEMNLLCQEYPEAECELDYSSAFQLLTAVIMSAQTTDVTVNKVTPTLFERFPDAKSLAEADLDEIKEIIKPTGFFNAKANNIQKCAQALVANFGGEVPKTIEELTTLPGVGRKTANVVLGVVFGVPGWTVDTHVQRLSARLGFTKNTEPEKIEVDLQNLFPNQDWSQLSITLIWHGRRMCYARKPDCPRCPVQDLCPSAMV